MDKDTKKRDRLSSRSLDPPAAEKACPTCAEAGFVNEPMSGPTELDVHCPECDYNLTGAPGDRCPWCGWKIDVDVLITLAEEKPAARRISMVVAGLVLGVGSFIAVAALAFRSTRLSLYDAVTILGVLTAGSGHVGLAILAWSSQAHWPIRHREAGDILRFVGWFSLLAGVIGASGALNVAPTARGVQGVAVSGVFEFLLRALFFTIPGCTLLALRLVSFRGRNDLAASRSKGKTSDTIGLPSRAPFTVEVFGRYTRDQLAQHWRDEPRPTTPAIEAAIARTWETELALAKQDHRVLYNGELARLVQVTATSSSLALELGKTCYRDFVGTNLHNAAMVLQANPASLANPVGISATVITCDGFLAFGRRSRRVAYHQSYLHPFGGMLESADRLADSRVRSTDQADRSYDIFGSAIRELQEELGIETSEIVEIIITGLIHDRSLYQPELLCDVALTLTREVLTTRFHPTSEDGEHTDIEFVYDDPETILSFLEHTTLLTPVTHGAILLHGRHNWGETWYEQTCFCLYGELPPFVGAPH